MQKPSSNLMRGGLRREIEGSGDAGDFYDVGLVPDIVVNLNLPMAGKLILENA
ncbi:hypothetical protein LMG24238_07418 [Paraburkholderia sediminicola]|uniref:Uncharacterized protein n=1 Tax=Paraburkholderia sediminicola TaxID=458836 RepID=A0A6J5CUK4_9BURK|nr:hypothetical protein [Paraburkholderia sediminicola]CAB3744981.1 hypothetical protein LMG24238_07418 [Paraburkholderia sediminicola]